MMPAAFQLKLIVAVILLAFAGLGLWYLYHCGYLAGEDEIQVKWDADKVRRDEAQKDALITYANQLRDKEIQHDKDQAVINQLADDARRVRIHLPVCPDNTASAAAGQNGEAGLLSGRMDQLFAEFQTKVGSLIARCDQMNIDAIRANAGH